VPIKLISEYNVNYNDNILISHFYTQYEFCIPTLHVNELQNTILYLKYITIQNIIFIKMYYIFN